MNVHRKNFPAKRWIALTSIAATLTFSGCGSDSDNTLTPTFGLSNAGVIASVNTGYTAGAINLIDLDSPNYNAYGPYHEDESDLDVVGGEGSYYILGRFKMDYVAKVDLSNLARKTWNDFSVLAEGEQNSGNPYDLITVNDQKAYLLRYNSDKAWIVNPSATNEADFFITELDLSAYTPSGGQGVPNAAAGTIVDNKLFILMQRLDSDARPTNDSYVVVFDVVTDSEIDIITLQGRNPSTIDYLPEVGLIVSSIGTYEQIDWDTGEVLEGAVYNGGIEVIYPSTDAIVSQVVDDTVATGQVSNIAIIDKDTAYFIGYHNSGSSQVFKFDPTPESNETADQNYAAVAGYTNGDYRDVAVSPKGNLWLADADTRTPGIHIINPTNDVQIKFVDSPRGLLPNSIAFATEK